MSLQDTSFPNDMLFEELNFLSNDSSQNFQFPSNRRAKRTGEQKLFSTSTSLNTSPSSTIDHDESAVELAEDIQVNAPTTTTTTELCKVNETGDDGPTSLEGDGNSKTNTYQQEHIEKNNFKRHSYQDIHSNRVKRRFAHVESQVGKYIAKMKEEDLKHRNLRFQRHRSMPGTLSETAAITNTAVIQPTAVSCGISVFSMDDDGSGSTSTVDDCHNNVNFHRPTSYSADQLHNASMDDSVRTEPDATDDANCNILASKLTNGILLEQDAKERADASCEYLLQRNDEQLTTIIRLKRNVDYLRIELANSQDKVKHLNENLAGFYARNATASIGSLTMRHCKSNYSMFNRHLWCTCHNEKCTRATQTEDTHTTVIDREVLRERSESFKIAILPTLGHDNVTNNININNSNNMERIFMGSSDSAIDVETIEYSHPQADLIQSPRLVRARSHSQREFIYYNGRGDNGGIVKMQTAHDQERVMMLNDSHNNNNNNNNISSNTSGDALLRDDSTRIEECPIIEDYGGDGGGGGAAADQAAIKMIRKRKKNTLRRRWLSLFGRCVRCDDPNQTVDPYDLVNNISQTQVPLLEKSSSNHCHVR